MRKVKLATNYYYHVYNRGVDKRKVFLSNTFYYRFIRGLFEFNDLNAALNFSWRMRKENYRGSASIIREQLVDIICFCLMPNHFHLILKQKRKEGIAKFMQKIGTGYTMYFNQKCQRTGSLFEGRFKAILIEGDEYLTHLSRYIHLNPVGLVESGWKEKGVKNWQKVGRFLKQYKWSSYLDYLGKDNFTSIINKKFLLGYFKSGEEYRKFVRSWAEKDIGLVTDLFKY